MSTCFFFFFPSLQNRAHKDNIVYKTITPVMYVNTEIKAGVCAHNQEIIYSNYERFLFI